VKELTDKPRLVGLTAAEPEICKYKTPLNPYPEEGLDMERGNEWDCFPEESGVESLMVFHYVHMVEKVLIIYI
jgi:hypothetical protein